MHIHEVHSMGRFIASNARVEPSRAVVLRSAIAAIVLVAATGCEEGSAPLGSNASTLGTEDGAACRLYASYAHPAAGSAIVALDAASGTHALVLSTDRDVAGITISLADGELYAIANGEGGDPAVILRVNAESGTLEPALELPELHSVQGLAIDAEGHIWTAVAGEGLVELDASGELVAGPAEGCGDITAIAFDPEGVLFGVGADALYRLDDAEFEWNRVDRIRADQVAGLGFRLDGNALFAVEAVARRARRARPRLGPDAAERRDHSLVPDPGGSVDPAASFVPLEPRDRPRMASGLRIARSGRARGADHERHDRARAGLLGWDRLGLRRDGAS